MTIHRIDRRIAELEKIARSSTVSDLSQLTDAQLVYAEAILTRVDGDVSSLGAEELRFLASLPITARI